MQTLKDDVKNKILSAALTEFEQHGYSQSSMRRIASSAGVTTGNIYRYFKNKDDLFQVLLQPTYEKFLEYTLVIQKEIETNYKKDATEVFEYIRLVDETIVELLKESSVEIKILLNLSEGSIYEKTRYDLISIAKQILERVFKISRETEQLSFPDQLSTEMYATTIIEGICMILKEYDDGDAIKYLVDELLHIYSVGIADKVNR